MAFVVSGKSLSRTSLGVLFQPHDIAILMAECSKCLLVEAKSSPPFHLNKFEITMSSA